MDTAQVGQKVSRKEEELAGRLGGDVVEAGGVGENVLQADDVAFPVMVPSLADTEFNDA